VARLSGSPFPLKFRGTPRAMEAFVALPVDAVASPLTVELTGQKLPKPANVHAVPVAPGIVRLKLGLSRSLPPAHTRDLSRSARSDYLSWPKSRKKRTWPFPPSP
jgi:hypothetical protein